MYKAIVFAGTTEGYEICRFLSANKISALACVATEYGSHSLEAGDYLKIQAKRLDEQEMTELFHKELPEFILDATHPYATEVTKNIKSAALASGISYIRVLRAESQSQNAVYVETAEQAVEYLRDREGRIFLTTGSKELAAFTTLPDYRERIYARVLSLPSVVEACQKLGFEGKHLIAMQGPFSKEMNEATLRQYECQYLVTKDSGKAGGFQEKIDAAFACGVIPVIIGRPVQEEGISLTECKRMLAKYFFCEGNQHITLLGIGMGSEDTLTIQGKRAVEKADLIIGARRIADAVALPGQEVFYEYRSREIVDYIQNHPEYSNIVVALSGDVGFYSGARKLLELFGEASIQPEIICGISSVVYFMSKIGLSWDNAKIVSAHGKNCNLISLIYSYEKTFAILGTADGVAELAKKQGTSVSYVDTGDTLHLKEMTLQCLYPNADETAADCNGLSQVWELRSHAFSMLFTGDLGEEQEKLLLKRQRLHPVTALKVAHHGSRFSSCEEFLNYIHPKAAFISSSAHNRYHHPSQEALERLEKEGCDIYCTKDCGQISILYRKGQWQIRQ